MQVNVLIDISVLQSSAVDAQIVDLIGMRRVEVGREVTLVLGEDLGPGLVATEVVAQGSLDDDLIENGAVIKGDGQSVGDGALAGLVVVLGELGVLDAADALTEVLEQRGGGGLGAVGVVGGSQASEDEHGTDHVL